MADQTPNRPDQGMKLSRFSRTTSFWLLLILMSVLAVQLVSSQGEATKDLTYQEYVTQRDARNIAEVTIFDKTELEGTLRAPMNVEGREVSQITFLFGFEVTREELDLLAQNNTVVNTGSRQNTWTTILITMLPWVLVLVVFLWIMRSMQAGGNRAFQFGRSRAKLISPDTPKVTFADVAGADEAKEELYEIIEFLKDPQRFARLGGRLPKGVLLVGPPGTGKTLLAKAVAGEAARPFFQMSGSDFVEMFVGVGASRVRDLFEQGKAHAPCIIFVDEIDAVGRHRGAGLGGGHDEREQTLNALLVEMDGFESNEGVILLAATNRPDVLDPALLRPGRFDRRVVVDAPDVKGREGILRVHARKLPLADDVNIGILAKGTPGLSGADLANICNEAALLAARGSATRVTMFDFEQAKDKVMLGAERRSLVLTEFERKMTAYHEAGHAVIGLKLPGLDPVHKVTIVPRGRALGITASVPAEDRHSYTKEWLEGQLCMLFGGRVAEEMTFGEGKVSTGAGNDIERATGMARRMVTRFGMSDVIGLMAIGDSEQEVFLGREIGHRQGVSEHTAQRVDEEVKRILDEAHEQARVLLAREQELLETIAQTLLDRETIGRSEILLLAEGKPLPPVDPDSGGPGTPPRLAHRTEVVEALHGDAEDDADDDADDDAELREGDEVEQGVLDGMEESSSSVTTPTMRRTPDEAEGGPATP